MSYQQLTEGKRYQISVLLAEGLSQSMIARKLDVHPSTISRELRRNRQGDAYVPDVAQQLAQARKAKAGKYQISQDTVGFIELLLSWEWSPEQISAISYNFV